MNKIFIPLSVAKSKHNEYKKNYKLATRNTGKLFLFAGDQKVEHLNDDFYGPNIDKADAYPEHLFEVAKNIPGAVLATHIGLLSQYGQKYKQLPFILKMDGKTNIDDNKDLAYSASWAKAQDYIDFKKQSGLKIVGLGYTIYLGSQFEYKMMQEAQEMVRIAHQAGILAIIWMYPRHSSIKNEDDIHLIAGGAGVAASLGADFVKVKYPYSYANNDKKASEFQEVVKAAGRTKIICVGGSKQKEESLIDHLNRQMKNGSSGLAIGRNIHQRSLKEASSLGKALCAIIHDNKSKAEALKILKNKNTKKKSLTKKRKANRSKLLGLF